MTTTTDPTTAREHAASMPADAQSDGEALMSGQRVRVCLEGGDPYEVRTTNADRVRFDLTAPKHKWPDAQTAPFLWFTFLAWSASRREGRTELRFEQFADATLEVEALDVTDDDGVRPTPPGRG